MKRLFSLKRHGHQLPDLFFPNKVEAKAQRDTLNKLYGGGYTVTRGPDHRRGLSR